MLGEGAARPPAPLRLAEASEPQVVELRQEAEEAQGAQGLLQGVRHLRARQAYARPPFPAAARERGREP